MFSRFKKKSNLAVVPDWASFFNLSEYKKFVEVVEDYFKSKEINYQVSDDIIKVTNNDFGFNQLGLLNVAQLCKLEGTSKYKNIVTEHFEGLIRAHQFDMEFKKCIDDFDKVEEYIGVRLYNDDYIEQVGHGLIVSEVVASGIHKVLIFDMPHSVTSIQPEQISKWGKSNKELFEVGEKNIRSKYDFEISQEDLGNFKVWFVQSDHFFTPNILLDIDQHPEIMGMHGSLIGVPHRHAAIFYPIQNLGVINAINQLIPIVKGMNAEGPGSLSSKLYWFKGGEIIELPSEINDNKLKFMPPEAFVNMLNELEESNDFETDL